MNITWKLQTNFQIPNAYPKIWKKIVKHKQFKNLCTFSNSRPFLNYTHNFKMKIYLEILNNFWKREYYLNWWTQFFKANTSKNSRIFLERGIFFEFMNKLALCTKECDSKGCISFLYNYGILKKGGKLSQCLRTEIYNRRKVGSLRFGCISLKMRWIWACNWDI